MEEETFEAIEAEATPVCGACGAPYDLGDNFCRQCGSTVAAQVPSVRAQYDLAVVRPPLSPVLRGAVILAAGTIAEILVRRALTQALRPRNLVPLVRGGAKAVQAIRRGTPATPVESIESETILLKRVRFRR